MSESPETELNVQALAGFQTKLKEFAEVTLATDAQRALLAAMVKIARNISTEKPADGPAFNADFDASFTPSQAKTILEAASALVFHSNLIGCGSLEVSVAVGFWVFSVVVSDLVLVDV